MKALVLLSGGQDSTTCLFFALKLGYEVTCLSFDYGQKHVLAEEHAIDRVLEVAQAVYAQEIPHTRMALDIFKELNNSALIGSGDVRDKHPNAPHLPASFVPGRNIFFLTIAGALAFKLGIPVIFTGVSQEDYSGYPDCRSEFIIQMEQALGSGLDTLIQIHTPLVNLTKADEIRLARDLPGCMEAMRYAHTCYEGVEPGCGNCPACILRAKGFKEAGVVDPRMEE